MTTKRLVRTYNDKMLSGLSGGLGDYFNIDPFFVRAGFVILTVTTGFGIPLYAIMALLTPSSKKKRLDGADLIKDNFDSFWDGDMAELAGDNASAKSSLLPKLLLGLGVILVLAQANISFAALFPWLLIGVGGYLIWKR